MHGICQFNYTGKETMQKLIMALNKLNNKLTMLFEPDPKKYYLRRLKKYEEKLKEDLNLKDRNHYESLRKNLYDALDDEYNNHNMYKEIKL
jgi:hypothetical protein